MVCAGCRVEVLSKTSISQVAARESFVQVEAHARRRPGDGAGQGRGAEVLSVFRSIFIFFFPKFYLPMSVTEWGMKMVLLPIKK